jgi:predicted amidohydrolase
MQPRRVESRCYESWHALTEITKAQWRAGAYGTPGKLAQINRSGADEGLRESIFLAWRAIATAPSDIKQLYAQVLEAEILRAAASLNLRARDCGLAFVGKESDQEIVRRLGGCLRALEQEFSARDLGGRPADPNDDWLVRYAEDSAFLVPMGRLAWREAKDPTKDSRPFDQRGVLRLRLIPTVIDGATVKLVRPDHLSKRDTARFGAVLFPNAEFKCTETATNFIIDAVNIPGGAAIITSACEAAHSSGCLTAVFPELTIDPQSRNLIQDLLLQKPWLHGSTVPVAPSFVVAGSWHEPIDKGLVNVATVFDGHGEELLRHRKRFAYKDPDGRFEQIQTGDEFAILVLEDGLFAFGICLDFCNRCFDTVYGRLDVDFVIVPSCGDAKTMDSHIRTARDLHDSRKTRSFVVQQAYPAVAAGAGYVLNPDGNSSGWTAAGLLKADAWSVFAT